VPGAVLLECVFEPRRFIEVVQDRNQRLIQHCVLPLTSGNAEQAPQLRIPREQLGVESRDEVWVTPVHQLEARP